MDVRQVRSRIFPFVPLLSSTWTSTVSSLLRTHIIALQPSIDSLVQSQRMSYGQLTILPSRSWPLHPSAGLQCTLQLLIGYRFAGAVAQQAATNGACTSALPVSFFIQTLYSTNLVSLSNARLKRTARTAARRRLCLGLFYYTTTNKIQIHNCRTWTSRHQRFEMSSLPSRVLAHTS